MPPFFALPWFITWFSHDVTDINVVARLFDVFMGSHPLLPLYVCTAVCIFTKYNSACVTTAVLAYIYIYMIILLNLPPVAYPQKE